jgi:hypothetical protein
MLARGHANDRLIALKSPGLPLATLSHSQPYVFLCAFVCLCVSVFVCVHVSFVGSPMYIFSFCACACMHVCFCVYTHTPRPPCGCLCVCVCVCVREAGRDRQMTDASKTPLHIFNTAGDVRLITYLASDVSNDIFPQVMAVQKETELPVVM